MYTYSYKLQSADEVVGTQHTKLQRSPEASCQLPSVDDEVGVEPKTEQKALVRSLFTGLQQHKPQRREVRLRQQASPNHKQSQEKAGRPCSREQQGTGGASCRQQQLWSHLSQARRGASGGFSRSQAEPPKEACRPSKPNPHQVVDEEVEVEAARHHWCQLQHSKAVTTARVKVQAKAGQQAHLRLVAASTAPAVHSEVGRPTRA